jgi:hypothetical protein
LYNAPSRFFAYFCKDSIGYCNQNPVFADFQLEVPKMTAAEQLGLTLVE